MKLKAQVGVEVYDEGKRTIRLTPVEVTAEVPEQFGQIILMGVGIADSNDRQPGDGDVDFPIGKVDKVADGLGWAKAALTGFKGDANAFLRIKQV